MTPWSAQAAHQAPHVLAERHVDAGGGLVEEQNARSCESALAISTRLFMPPTGS